ncbi:MAG TPA: aldo/keto reductase [Ruminiclostridium sp.]|jgi:aryl-alcohol dehydrogenase-like predicted oxidoreductase|nr:aldo/keto reductase [Ruminiclostridium sp.]
MEYRELGSTGLKVSRLCFGGLTVGPLQKNLSTEEGGEVIAEAFRLGVNFIDTADLYDTYRHIKRAMDITGIKPVISSKSYAYDREGAKRTVDKALTELGLDHIDLWLMHEQESEHTIRGHREALDYYLELKDQGVIGAVGLSTHHIAAVRAALEVPELEVIHPIVNKAGLGLCDGTMDEMLDALKLAYEQGKAIYGMKPFGGGNLLHSFRECLDFVASIPYLHSIALGMQSIEEVRMNVALFDDLSNASELIKDYHPVNTKALHVDFWCEACGTCTQRCKQHALSLVDGKLSIEREKCVLCGYCASVCPVFALKMY